MRDKRRARKAKQARRDVRRAARRARNNAAEPTLMDILRRAVAREHPLNLLSIASLFINVGKPDAHGRERYLDDVLTSWIGAPGSGGDGGSGGACRASGRRTGGPAPMSRGGGRA